MIVVVVSNKYHGQAFKLDVEQLENVDSFLIHGAPVLRAERKTAVACSIAIATLQ